MTLLPSRYVGSIPGYAAGAGPEEEPAPGPATASDGRYATMPCGSMTYFLAAPWSKRW